MGKNRDSPLTVAVLGLGRVGEAVTEVINQPDPTLEGGRRSFRVQEEERGRSPLKFSLYPMKIYCRDEQMADSFMLEISFQELCDQAPRVWPREIIFSRAGGLLAQKHFSGGIFFSPPSCARSIFHVARLSWRERVALEATHIRTWCWFWQHIVKEKYKFIKYIF